MTAVEFLLEKYKSQNTLLFAEDWQQAKEMEKIQKIEFACAVYDKYNFCPQEISFREECEQFKLE